MSIYFNIYQTACCDYYDEEWRPHVFNCPVCGWEGGCDEMDGPNVYNELMDYGCPACDKMLLIVNFPILHEIMQAANRGNPIAMRDLKSIGDLKKIIAARTHEETLDDPDYLPGGCRTN